MQYFASVTKNVSDQSKRNAVLMGRKCWESIPVTRRPLAGRLNIVLSRQLPAQKSDDYIVVNSLEAAMKLLSEPPFVDSIETIWNIGGAEIYDLALRENLVDEIHLTRIFKNFEADVHLKSLDFSKMEKVQNAEVSSENSEIFEENGLKFEFCKWKVVENH